MKQFPQGFLPSSSKMQLGVLINLKSNSENRNNSYILFPRAIATDEIKPFTPFPGLWNEFPEHQIKIIRDRFEFNKTN
jgi:hypothetical protein